MISILLSVIMGVGGQMALPSEGVSEGGDEVDTVSRSVSGDSVSSDSDNSRDNSGQSMTMESTAYTATCVGCSGITYEGIDVRQTIHHEGKRIIAVDPDVITLGSAVIITLSNGEQFEALALDIGGDIKRNRIDVLMKTRAEALRFGR